MKKTLFLVYTAFLAGDLYADWRDDIGLTQLETELGINAPTGSGLNVVQVEAPISTGAYLPQSGQTGTGNFSGKSFLNISGLNSGASNHAATVGNFWYGNSAGVASGVSAIRSFEANDFIGGGYLNVGSTTSQPENITGSIQNHSWIANLSNATQANETLRRLDFAIERDAFLACVGVNNGSSTSIPQLMASAYNVLGVGRTNGGHSRGTTPSSVDGGGRLAVEIVAPQTATSWSTAIVSGAASLLLDTTEGQGQPSEVLKAVLLAGATKSEFGNWSRTQTQPLDAVFGAGELNVYNNHQIITAGEQNSSIVQEIGSTGWDYRSSLTPNIAVPYYFSVPAGFHAIDVSAALTWNRTIENSGSRRFFIPSPITHNFSLKLSESSSFTVGSQVDFSDSALDNVEHVYQESLSSGQYVLEVTSDTNKDYALAWRATILPNPDITVIEGSISEGGSNFILNVNLSAPAQVDTQVSYSTASVSATAGEDFQATSGVLTIQSGQTSGQIIVPILEDMVEESDESFRVDFSSPVNGNLLVNQVSVTILDNDPQPDITIADVEVDETDSSVSVLVTLSATANMDVQVDYATLADTAIAGDDFSAANGTLIIPEGDLTAMINIGILADTLAEVNETFSIELSNVANAIVVGSSATITIVDDDALAMLENASIGFVQNSSTGEYSISWPAVVGRLYSVETSLLLDNDWMPLDGAVGLSADAVQEQVDLGSYSDLKRFFRIVDVSNNPPPGL